MKWALLGVLLGYRNIRPSIPEIHFLRAAYQQWDSLLYWRWFISFEKITDKYQAYFGRQFNIQPQQLQLHK